MSKDENWIIITDVDQSHIETIESFSEVLYNMGVDVDWEEDDYGEMKITLEMRQYDETSI